MRCCILAMALWGCAPAYSGSYGEPPRGSAPGGEAGQDDARPSVPLAQFPDPADVEAQMRSHPAPDARALLATAMSFVDHWDIQATPAPGDAQYAPEGTLEARLDALAQAPSSAEPDPSAPAGARPSTLTRSASLRCAAQELARFAATHGSSASDHLMQHILAVCGASALRVRHASRMAQVTGSIGDERAITHLLRGADEMLVEALGSGEQLGAAFARAPGRVAFTVLVGRPQIAIDRVEPPSADGLAIVRGRVLVPADALIALINQGPVGVAACRVTPGIALPDFELRCPMAAGDATALVRAQSLRRGQVLAPVIGQVLIRRAPDARPAYDVAPVGAASPVADASDVGPAFVERLNAVRASLGLGPLVLSPGQSAIQQGMVPYLIAHLAGGHELPELIDLHLLAGRGISGGTIRGASLCADVLRGSRDIARLLALLLLDPIQRYILLRPEAHQLAVGASVTADPDSVAVVASTYAFFEDLDHRRDADAIFERIVAARADRGLPPPERLEDLPALEARARSVAERGANPYAALMAGLHEEAARARGRFGGAVQETVFLELWPVPEELVRDPLVRVGVVVTHTRAPGGAWGQYVVAILHGR